MHVAAISSLSGLMSNSDEFARFKSSLVNWRTTKVEEETNKDLLYVPTAMYAPNPVSTRTPGEIRRRARYDAKQKMNLLAKVLPCFSGEPRMLELDAPNMTEQTIRDALSTAAYVYVDGGNTFY